MKKILKVSRRIFLIISSAILFVPALIILMITEIREENRLIKMLDNKIRQNFEKDRESDQTECLRLSEMSI